MKGLNVIICRKACKRSEEDGKPVNKVINCNYPEIIGDLTCGEIAEIMSVSPEQVKNYIFRERKNF